jgi:hypothetical protein
VNSGDFPTRINIFMRIRSSADTSLVLDGVELDIRKSHSINRLDMTVSIDWIDGTNERFTQATDVRWQVASCSYVRTIEIGSDILKAGFSAAINEVRVLTITTGKRPTAYLN